jgi:ubiquinone/menaquinone biosynthesis C-methylase UbiE
MKREARQNVDIRLPSLDLIEDEQTRFLYRYDTRELFNPDERNMMRFWYETKLNLVLDIIDKKAKRGDIVIDIGSAQGNYTLSIASKGMYSIGVELRKQFIKYAKMKAEKCARAKSDFVVGNAEYLPFRSGSANCVYLGELLEHLSEPAEVLRETSRVLRAGAFSIISTPNAERFRSTTKETYADVSKMSKVALDRLKFGANTHVFEFTKEELLTLLSTQFRILCFKYLWFVPPISLLYKIPLPTKIIRKIEMLILCISAIAPKLAADMVCIVVTPRTSMSVYVT